MPVIGAATYSGNPSSSPVAGVRHLCGDTGLDREFYLSDAEITFEIAGTADVLNGNAPRPYSAAVMCAERIAARIAQRVNVVDGDAQRNLSDQLDHYVKLIARLEREARAREGASPNEGIPSRAGRVGADNGPYFTTGMMDSPAAQSPQVVE